VKPFAHLAVCLLVMATSAFAEPYPRVPFIFGYLPFDQSCEQWTNTHIDPQGYTELEGKIKAFQDAWNRDGAPLLEATVAETKKPFPYDEMIVTLTLCRISSMSRPLLVNVRPYLDGPTNQHPRAMRMFVGDVFHELLHLYVIGARPKQTPLMERYKDEDPLVKYHLHLDAVMKMAYLKLHREDELREIIEFDSRDPPYRKAWHIVNDVEGYEAFVRELE